MKFTNVLIFGGPFVVFITVVSFAIGFHINQPSLVSDNVKDVRDAASSLEELTLAAKRDPRMVNIELTKLSSVVSELPNSPAKSEILNDLQSIQDKLKKQNDLLEDSLWETYTKAGEIRRNLDETSLSTESLALTTYDQARRLVLWLTPVGIGILILAVFLFSNPGTRKWISRTDSLSLGPLSISVGDTEKVREGVKERFNEVDSAISKNYQTQLEKVDANHLFSVVKAELDKKFLESQGVNLNHLKHRATLWVPGFSGWELIQAARYFGHPEPESRLVIGRRFSVRYGIIGRAWRLRTSQYNWSVHNNQQALVRHWGLTLQEARKQGDEHQSLMALVIPSDQADGDPLGVIYLEADGENSLMPATGIDELKKLVADDPSGRLKADRLLQDSIWAPLLDGDAVKHLTGALINLRRQFNWDIKIDTQAGR